MKQLDTREYLLIGMCICLAITAVSYVFPAFPERVRDMFAGQFLTYSGALLLALHATPPKGP